MHKGLSVVIPNYNGTILFPQTLPSVFIALQNISLPYEIIVADDCSTDDSIIYLSKNYPQVKIISNQINNGFSVTANKGIASAQYELVLLLNSDVKLEPDYFIHQLKYFDRPDTFGVMGRIIGWYDDEIQDGAKYPYFHGVKIKTSGNYLLKNEEEMKDGLYSMYLSGANAFLSKKVFTDCGGFNELFSPFYVEDYELSLRAWRLGYKCYYEHNAICRHKTSTTIKSKSKDFFTKTIYNRNKMFLHAIHLNASKRYLWFVQTLTEVTFQSILGKIHYSKAFFLFIKNYNKVIVSRRELKKVAKEKDLLSLQKVTQIIKTSISNKEVYYF